MMRPMQSEMDLGAGDFVARTHISPRGNYRHQVYLANNENGWAQRGFNIQRAIVYANDMSDQEILDCYVSANGFSWEKDSEGNFKGRTTANVSDVQSLYVDFDYYNRPEYAHLSVADFSQLVLDENPWLPSPTFIIASRGNDEPGCWFIWGFKEPLPINKKTERYPFLPAWQTLQDFLIDKLKSYGADSACSDAARVLRLPGTVNSKSNAAAAAWELNPRYKFNDLRQKLNIEFQKDNPKKKLVPESPKEAKQFRTNRGKVSQLFTYHNLAYLRRNDLHKLAALRGGRFSDHNRMVIWIYAVVSCNYCKDETSLRNDVEGFIQDCSNDPKKYSKVVNYESTVRRFNRWKELREEIGAKGVRERCNDPGDPLDWRDVIYRLTRKYIVDQLEITPGEGRKMKALFDDSEKQRRNTVAKRTTRRLSGVKPREEYLSSLSKQKALALRLRADGWARRRIAEEISVSERTITNYLSQAASDPL